MSGDEFGLFWEEEVKERTVGAANRGVKKEKTAKEPKEPKAKRAASAKGDAVLRLPPVPETSWRMPTEFPDLSSHGMISIDVESKDPLLLDKGPGYIRGDAYISGVAIGTEAGYRAYYPVRHEGFENLDPGKVFGWLKEELSRPRQPKIGANIRYDVEALHFAGVAVKGELHDVMNSATLLDETHFSYSLENIAQRDLAEGKVEHEMMDWIKRAFGTDEKFKSNIWRTPPAVVGPYAISDIDLPLRLFKKHKKQLVDRGLWDLYMLETRLVPILVKMRLRGARVDEAAVTRLRESLTTRLTVAENKLSNLAGRKINVNSANDLAIVYDRAGIEYNKTEKGKPSFTKEWLSHNKHPISDMVNDVRHLSKFIGTFVDGYLIDSRVNGRVHTQFNQLKSDEGGTISGRLSSSKPNLQNIPVRTSDGKLIREAFIPDEGRKWWSIDWSQVEYRIIAHYAAITNQPGADKVVESYLNDPNIDYHQMVALMTALSRDNAKTLNFGLAYGQGVDLLCSNLGVSRERGKQIIREYHDKAPFIRPLMNMVSERAGNTGLVKTLLGRQRNFNTFEKRDGAKMVYSNTMQPGFKRAFLHKALNSLIQGSAADVMKKAMDDCEQAGLFDVIGIPMLTVHDELDGDYEEHNPAHVEALQEVKHIMQTCVKLKVPLLADLKTGNNWKECK